MATFRVTWVVVAVLGTAVWAGAQTTRHKWEVEVHGGGLLSSNTTAGAAIAEFPAGQPIPTGGGSSTSRAVSSWYYGDGALLLNQVNASFLVSARVAPLDPALRRRIGERKSGADFGVRIARMLAPRLAVEFNVDYSPTSLELTPAATATIDASRASFVPAWNALLATGATTNRTVTSTADFTEGNGRQTAVTGAFKILLTSGGRVHPYVTAGGGVALLGGSTPNATLTGEYSFLFGGLFPMNDRDVVTVGVKTKDRVALGLVGGGIEYDISPRHGFRADARLRFSPNKTETVVSATPSSRDQTPVFAITTPFPPTIQFSNSRSINRPTSLSGPAVTDFVTFAGSGMETQMSIAVGYFVRF